MNFKHTIILQQGETVYGQMPPPPTHPDPREFCYMLFYQEHWRELNKELLMQLYMRHWENTEFQQYNKASLERFLETSKVGDYMYLYLGIFGRHLVFKRGECFGP